MKRIVISTSVVLSILFILFAGFYFCNNVASYFSFITLVETDKETSIQNFSKYTFLINEILKGYGYDKTVAAFSPTSSYGEVTQECRIDFADDIVMYIDFKCYGFTDTETFSDSGLEYFCVNYNINTPDEKMSTEQIKLFCDIVNVISSYKLNYDYCNEFLEAPESKYPSDKYIGYEKNNSDIISKRKAINFFEDWIISYKLMTNNHKTLQFEGYTIAATR